MPVVLKVRVADSFRDLGVLKSGKPYAIGRLDHCDFAFPDDIEMSGRHLSLSLNADNSCSYSDPGSTNGTFVNDKHVAAGILRPGDILRCGLTQFCIQQVDDAKHPEHKAGTPPHEHPAAVPPREKIQAARTQPSNAEGSHLALLPDRKSVV